MRWKRKWLGRGFPQQEDRPVAPAQLQYAIFHILRGIKLCVNLEITANQEKTDAAVITFNPTFVI